MAPPRSGYTARRWSLVAGPRVIADHPGSPDRPLRGDDAGLERGPAPSRDSSGDTRQLASTRHPALPRRHDPTIVSRGRSPHGRLGRPGQRAARFERHAIRRAAGESPQRLREDPPLPGWQRARGTALSDSRRHGVTVHRRSLRPLLARAPSRRQTVRRLWIPRAVQVELMRRVHQRSSRRDQRHSGERRRLSRSSPPRLRGQRRSGAFDRRPPGPGVRRGSRVRRSRPSPG